MVRIQVYLTKKSAEIQRVLRNLNLAQEIHRNIEIVGSMSDIELRVYNSNLRSAYDPVCSTISELDEQIGMFFSQQAAYLVRGSVLDLQRKMERREMKESEYDSLRQNRSWRDLFSYLTGRVPNAA